MTRKTKRVADETASGIVPNSGNCPDGQTPVATAKGIECIDEATASATTTHDAPKKVTSSGLKITEQDEEDSTTSADLEDEFEEDEESFSLGDAKILKEKLDVLFPANEDGDEEPELNIDQADIDLGDDDEDVVATANDEDEDFDSISADLDDEELETEAISYGQLSSGDAQSHRRRTEEYLKHRKISEAKRKLRTQELYAKQLEVANRIKVAKGEARPRFNIPDNKNVDKAYESQVSQPAHWFESVSKGENVMPSSVWQINKEKIFENYGQRFTRHWDKDFIERFDPLKGEERSHATEAVSGPPAADFMRTMSEQVLVLPNGKIVTPVRQFCEVKILPPGVKEAFFYDYGAVDFAAITEGSTISDSSVAVRSSGGATTPRGARVQINYSDIEESPIDLVAANNRAFALESVNDESKQVVNVAYNTDSGNAGDGSNRKAVGGGTKSGKWVNGNTGAAITADAGLTSSATLSFTGLLAAKRIIREQGLDTTNLVLYTSPKGIEDIIKDPNLDSYLAFSKPEAITEGVVERIAGCNIVTSSAVANLASGGVAGGKRSVLFIPGVAFGLVSGRDLTMEAQRRNEIQAIHLTGTQKIAGFVKNVEATCRVSHA